VAPSVARIKSKNAQWVQIASIWQIVDMDNPRVELILNDFPPGDLVEHIRAIHSAGLKVALRSNPFPDNSQLDDQFNDAHTNSWFDQFFQEVGNAR
jgi:hypothetical protein